MTSTAVKDVRDLMNYVAGRKSPGAKDSEPSAESFTDFLGKAAGNTGNTLRTYGDNRVQTDLSGMKYPSTASDKATVPDKAAASAGRPREPVQNDRTAETDSRPTGSQTAETDKMDGSESAQAVHDAAEEAGGQLVQEVADKLGVTAEEVQEAMEALGLTMIDLLNPDCLAQLVVSLTEGADMLTLVTDADLYQTFLDLKQSAQDSMAALAGKFNIRPEELKALLEEAGQTQTPIPGIPVKDQPGNEMTAGQRQEPMDKQPGGQKDYTVTVERNGETVQVNVKVDEGGPKAQSEEVTGRAPETADMRTTEQKQNSGQQQDGGQETTGQRSLTNGALFQNLNPAGAENVTAPAFDSIVNFVSPDTKQIMDQIMDYMKLQLRPGMTQMELQLHPASLGTVNVSIVAREGAITAQFLAQNETVKAALESQIVQLRNSFEDQGIKVEAVEVTLASHEFDRNLSQNSGRDAEQADQAGERKVRGVRKLNLNELDPEELPEDMDDAQRLSAEMMAASGNTVDYAI